MATSRSWTARVRQDDDFLRALLGEEATRQRQDRTLEGMECPECGESMLLRHNRSSNAPFAGCSTYPACTGTRNLRRAESGGYEETSERFIPKTDKERIQTLENEVSELKDKIAELMFYLDEGESNAA